MAKLVVEPDAEVIDEEDGEPSPHVDDTTPDEHEAIDRTASDVGSIRSNGVTVWRRLALVFLALALLGGVAFAAIQGHDRWDNHQRSDERSAAVATAEEVAIAISVSDYEDVDQNIAGVLKLATGNFAATVLTNKDSQTELVKAYQVKSTAKVEEVGLVSQSDDKVVVAVAISSLIKNSRNPTGQEQWYRMVIDLEQQTDGSWLASNVEFVQ